MGVILCLNLNYLTRMLRLQVKNPLTCHIYAVEFCFKVVCFVIWSQVCLEGQISRKSALKSLSTGRQPPGDQIPWKFNEQFQDTVFPTLSGARIVRIATHPSAMKVLLCFHIRLCVVGFSLFLNNSKMCCEFFMGFLQLGYGSQAVELLTRYVFQISLRSYLLRSFGGLLDSC